MCIFWDCATYFSLQSLTRVQRLIIFWRYQPRTSIYCTGQWSLFNPGMINSTKIAENSIVHWSSTFVTADECRRTKKNIKINEWTINISEQMNIEPWEMLRNAIQKCFIFSHFGWVHEAILILYLKLHVGGKSQISSLTMLFRTSRCWWSLYRPGISHWLGISLLVVQCSVLEKPALRCRCFSWENFPIAVFCKLINFPDTSNNIPTF